MISGAASPEPRVTARCVTALIAVFPCLFRMHLLSAPRAHGVRGSSAPHPDRLIRRGRAPRTISISARTGRQPSRYDHDLGGIDTPVTRPTSRQHEPCGWGRSGESVSERNERPDGGGPYMDSLISVLAFEALNARRMLGLFKKDSKVEAFKLAVRFSHRHRSGVRGRRPRLTARAAGAPAPPPGSAGNLRVRVARECVSSRPEIAEIHADHMLMQLKNAFGARGSESPDGWKPYGGRRVRYVIGPHTRTYARTAEGACMRRGVGVPA